MRIALAQINPTVGDLKGNQQKILEYLRRAKDRHADLVAFPELALCGYPPEDLLHKEHFIRDNLKAMQGLVKHAKDLTVIVGFVDRDQTKKLFNAAAVIGQGRLKSVYRKHELPNYGVFDEKRYFQPGETEQIFALGPELFGVNICEDIWVEDGICRRQARNGARLLVNISSSPYDVGKFRQRLRLLKRRAGETKAFIAYVNLVGGQDELVFDGGSFIVDPHGKIAAQAKEFEEDLLVADLDIPAVKTRLRKSAKVVHLQDPILPEKKAIGARLEKISSQNERIYKALVAGTRDYIQKNGFQKVLIGLSGGIDSALVAAIAREAVGRDNVVGVTMPSRYSSAGTRSDAKRLAENLGIRLLEIPIEDIFEAYAKALSPEFRGLAPNIAEENIQARIRGNLLMALSNKFGWLVLTTGNKSEFAVGYCTLYGDMSGGFAVIKDVPKTKVYEIAGLVNERHPGLIPESILERAPSAELRENQKDQDSLPPYDLLDKLLEQYVEHHRPAAKIAKISSPFSPSLASKVMTMVDKSEYKRRQAPPGVKITPRAFGKDWRLPITNRYKFSQ